MRPRSRALASLALGAFLLVSLAGAAVASKPKIVKIVPNPVTANEDGTWCTEVYVCNYGLPGDVELHGTPSSEVTDLKITPDHHVFDNGTVNPDCWWFKVCGTLTGRSGTVKLSLSYVDNSPGRTGAPIIVQQLETIQITR